MTLSIYQIALACGHVFPLLLSNVRYPDRPRQYGVNCAALVIVEKISLIDVINISNCLGMLACISPFANVRYPDWPRQYGVNCAASVIG